ncbi:hypothetical protein Trydic_g20491 [Trypoxylus dichotomus]
MTSCIRSSDIATATVPINLPRESKQHIAYRNSAYGSVCWRQKKNNQTISGANFNNDDCLKRLFGRFGDPEASGAFRPLREIFRRNPVIVRERVRFNFE